MTLNYFVYYRVNIGNTTSDGDLVIPAADTFVITDDKSIAIVKQTIAKALYNSTGIIIGDLTTITLCNIILLPIK